MRILIFDTNKVFANIVRSTIHDNWQDIKVDIVGNYHILLSRLGKHKYDFIVADIISAPNMELLLDCLRKERARGATVFTWSAAHKDTKLNLEKTAVLYRKPAPTATEIQIILGQFITTTSGQYPAVLEEL